METVNNIAAAATKAIWGESESPETTEAKNNAVVPETKKEPLSGALGDTKKGEPYDLGNAEEDPSRFSSTSDIVAKTLSDTHIAPLASSENPSTTSFRIASTHIAPLSSENPSTTDFRTTSEKPLISDRINPNLPLRSEDRTKTGTTYSENLGLQGKDIKPSESTDHGAPKGEVRGAASADADPKDVDVSGPGPSSLEEIARKNGGTSGAAQKPSSTANVQGVKTDLKPLSSDKQEKIDEEDTKDKGSGEQYIKSSGMKAEGGDFDATKPGAGREADRLLGKEGKVESTGGGVGSGGTGTAGVGESGSGELRKSSSEEGVEGEGGKKEGKLSHLKEKIKGKLHKH